MLLGMRWIISEASIEWQQMRMYSTHCSGYHVGFWIRQHLIFECKYRRGAKHDFSTIVKSKYRGNQIQEDIFRFFLIIWSQALAHCKVSVVIITILRALVLSADVKPENNFYTRFYTDISSF